MNATAFLSIIFLGDDIHAEMKHQLVMMCEHDIVIET